WHGAGASAREIAGTPKAKAIAAADRMRVPADIDPAPNEYYIAREVARPRISVEDFLTIDRGDDLTCKPIDIGKVLRPGPTGHGDRGPGDPDLGQFAETIDHGR